MMSKYSTPLSRLQGKLIFKAAEARDLGIPSRMLSHFCSQGLIARVGRGIYRHTSADTGLDLALEDLVITSASIPQGVVCLLSALCIYELTDQIMREYWIAIPNADKSPKRAHTRIVRMRNISLGKTMMPLGDYKIQIFDRERTVIDSFRYLSHEIAIKALQTYIKHSSAHKPDLKKLSDYAKTLKVNITPYLMALTT